MRAYRLRTLLLPTLGVAYVLIAQTAPQEIFPFFKWNLFSSVPVTAQRVHVKIHQIDGEELSPFDLVKDRATLRQRGFSVPYSMYSVRTLNMLGACLERSPASHWCRNIRADFERTFLTKVRSTSYRVIRLRYDPLELLRHGKYRERIKLASLHFERQP